MDRCIGENGRFEIVERLGVGGMGEVFKAYDTQLKEFVAIKSIIGEYAKRQDIINLFLNEAKTSLQITHKNVVRVRDILHFNGNYYLVMQFIDGHSLRSWMKAHPNIESRSAKEMLKLIKPILEALSHAHKYTVHRDIKPENIMLNREGDIFLMDFGIAKVIKGSYIQDTIQEQSITLGTPAYMAPEQLQGVSDIDRRVDIYAMGVLLYELLTRIKPHRERVIIPSHFNDSVTPELDSIILKMLAKNREERYGECDEIVHDMELALGGAGGGSTSKVDINRGGSIDGSNFVLVPAGKFYRGSGPESKIDVEKPRRRIYLDSYYISIFPVTNLEYRAFLDANLEIQLPKDFDTICTQKPNHPVTDVSWDDAMLYCRWVGATLPTEAQWEKASRGVKGRRYPWGNEFRSNHCNIENIIGETVAVESFQVGVSPYGCYQMAGNVWEWCLDDFQPNFYGSREGRLDNPVALTDGDIKVLRGGSFNFVKSSARTSYRYYSRRNHRDSTIGFRVVVSEI
jgi:serine/threonine protein kinase